MVGNLQGRVRGQSATALKTAVTICQIIVSLAKIRAVEVIIREASAGSPDRSIRMLWAHQRSRLKRKCVRPASQIRMTACSIPTKSRQVLNLQTIRAPQQYQQESRHSKKLAQITLYKQRQPSPHRRAASLASACQPPLLKTSDNNNSKQVHPLQLICYSNKTCS